MTYSAPAQAALAYVSLGWCVFPLAAHSKQPATLHGFHDATNDPDQVRVWWSERPRAGIGVACALSGLLVLDVDPRSGGNETLQRLVDELGPLPETVEGATGGGGRHLLFHLPEGMTRARGSLGPGVDVKLHGYIVAPPSVHPCGNAYAWARDPDVAALATLPARWLEAVKPEQRKPEPRSAKPHAFTGRSTAYGLAALEGECTSVKHAPEGARNNALNTAAFKVGQLEAGGELDQSDSVSALLEAAQNCGLSDREAQRTIDSGRRAGHMFPRRPDKREHKPVVDDEAPWPSQEFQAEGEPEWAAGLVFTCNKEGKRVLANTSGNLALLIAHSSGWERTLGYDELLQMPYWIGTPPELEGFSQPYGKINDEHACYIRQWMRRYHGIEWTKEAAWEAIASAATMYRFHPVQRYLESLEWDGEPRVGAWLQKYFPGTALPSMPTGGWWLISAVARAMRPGCQVDHMLVLEGPQGAGKSTAASILGGEWFSAEMGDVRDKDAAQSLAGVWIMEVAELDAMRRADMTRVKTFLTLRCDHFRPSYGRNVVDRPRQCVFMGTTNESKYLHDSSGGRRFWPVTVQPLDADGLYRDRDQLWAEAFALYRDGERWWPKGEKECGTLAKIVDERYAADPWEAIIADLMSTTTEEWSGQRILSQVLKIDPDRQDRTAMTRIGTIMARLQVQAKRIRVNGMRRTLYYGKPQVAPDDDEKKAN